MSRLEELIEKLCPNGVEYKKLSEITNLAAGERITKEMMNGEFEYDVYGGGVQPTGKYSNYNKEHSITISRAGSAGFVNWVEGKFWATDVCFVASEIHDNYNIKFIFYFVKNMQNELQKHIYGGNLPKLNKDFLWNLLVPIPPIEVQNEIVKILDAFTELQSELQSELQDRRKQYEYYRDELLKFDGEDEVEYKKLYEICNIEKGKQLNKDKLSQEKITEFPVAVINGGKTPSGYWSISNYDENKITISQGGASAGFVDFQLESFWAGGHCYVLTKETSIVNYKFLYYVMKQKEFELIDSQYGGGIPSLAKSTLEDLKIPIPSLEKQQKIVETLDKFDEYINSVENGLKAEIEARKQQYEYYRDELLKFNRL